MAKKTCDEVAERMKQMTARMERSPGAQEWHGFKLPARCGIQLSLDHDTDPTTRPQVARIFLWPFLVLCFYDG